MKIHLVLKAKWYDMIKSGIKLDEYRQRTPYWKKRIWQRRHEIDSVVFHRAYTSITTEKEIKEIVESKGLEDWGAVKGEVYYVLKTGNFIQ